MKKRIALFVIFAASSLLATAQDSTSLRKILLEQVKRVHNVSDWFVPVNTAIDGLTLEQANWSEKGNHSTGQLVHHLWFWNNRQLHDLRGEKNAPFSGNNDETFDKFDQKQWAEIVKDLDGALTDIEKWIEMASEDDIARHAASIASLCAHNAYHIGQIVSVRKAQGSWRSE